MLLAIGLMLLVASLRVNSLPLSCASDAQCSEGQYCDAAGSCRKCILCEDLKRELPALSSSCIKTVSDCGSCFKGLVTDSENDVNGQCVTPGMHNEVAAFPAYAWALIGVLLVFLLVIAAIVYVLRNPDSFKILASTRTSFRSPTYRNSVPGCQNEAPPPYNPQYEPVRAIAPAPYPEPFNDNYHEETEQPFIKSAPSSTIQGQRESGDNQSAIPYDLPVYVRYDPSDPFSPEPMSSPESDIDMQTENLFTIHDEDTMESQWTCVTNEVEALVDTVPVPASPSESDDADKEEGAMALALRDSLAGPPAAKKMRTSQDSNNNMGRESSSGSGSSSSSHSQPAVVINVLVNNNVNNKN